MSALDACRQPGITAAALLLALAALPTGAQEMRHGFLLPTQGEFRILVLFAEVDFADGPCPFPEAGSGDWIGAVPQWAGDLFDATKLVAPSAFITDLFRQASFGAYDLLADYYDKVFTIPCHEMNFGLGHLPVLERLAAEPSFTTHSGLGIGDFDLWSLTASGAGEPKLAQGDGRIDAVYILWRNNRFVGICGAGYAVHRVPTPMQIHGLQGVEAVASYNACGFPRDITVKEHMHGLFGGNQWHSGGGAGIHSTFNVPWVFGLTAQLQSMLTINAWDRWMMEWKHPDKLFLVSAGDQSVGEVLSDISIESHPSGASFVLRDFLTTGDTARIKLPHLDWQQPGDKQNQYLWLENRRMKNRLDKYYHEDCANQGSFPSGTPGIYAYVQVGKDQRKGPNLYAGNYASPNYPASWIFPLTAEGNFDHVYRVDLVQPGAWIACNWNNSNIPVDKAASLPNPFTGLHDLNGVVDSNGDGMLFSGDIIAGLSEVLDGGVIHNFHVSGDWKDAFGPNTGKTKLSLSTNPAPVPVYTHRHPGGVADSDNRTVWLNGLSIELVEAPGAPEEILVTVRWDEYTVEGSVRWTGNIHLSPNDFDPIQPSLVLAPGAQLVLDRGLSPTTTVAKDGFFSEPTVFTAASGSSVRLEHGSELVVVNGSELRLAPGSRLLLDNSSRLSLVSGGRLVIEDGAEVIVAGFGVIDVEAGGELLLANRTAGKGLILKDPPSRVRVAGALLAIDGAPLTFQGGGYLRFEAGNQVALSANSVVLLTGTGKGDLLVSLAEDAVVALNTVRVIVRNGRIEYGAGSRLQASGTGGGTSQAAFINLDFTSAVAGPAGAARDTIGLEAAMFRRVLVAQSEVRGLERGFVLSDMPFGLPSILNDIVFHDCWLAVEAGSLRALRLNRVRTSAQCLDGLRLESIQRVDIVDSEFGFHDRAVAAVDVAKLVVSGGRIGDSSTGIRALRTDVFLRDGAVIAANQVGIEVHGEPDDLAQVTVGDTGCATSIIDNVVGISGRDATFKLDALDNSCGGSLCPDLRPNRFDGNKRVLEGCYTNIQPWTTISMRGNYWGGGAATLERVRLLGSCTKPGGYLEVVHSFYFAEAPRQCQWGGTPVIEIGRPPLRPRVDIAQ